MKRVGMFLCTGCDIGKALKTDGFEALAKEAGALSVNTHPVLCAPEGQEIIRQAIEAGEMDGVLIAACSHREKIGVFRFDPTKVAVERVSLREQVAWSHKPSDEDTQMLAEDLLRMGLARVSKMELAKTSQEDVDPTVLVVGGGLTGLQAAKAAADLGHPAVLVENTEKLGGYLANVSFLVPEGPAYDSIEPNPLSRLIAEVESNPRIKTIKAARLKRIHGQPGQFSVEVESRAGTEQFMVGAIVQATGAKPYDANKLSHLGYGKSAQVITSNELEVKLTSGALFSTQGSSPRRVVFVQCAGSRDKNHLPYCSAECCATTLKQVAAIHRSSPDTECMVVYRDMRTPGQLERFYLSVQLQPGTLFTRGDVERVEVQKDGCLDVLVRNSLLGHEAALSADLVVLAVGMVPNSADGEAIRSLVDAKARIQKNESEKQVTDAQLIVDKLQHHQGTEILNLEYRQGPDLPALEYGFPDSHYICFPYESLRTGVYAAGPLHAPMGAAQAAEDGMGAALKAVQCISATKRGEAVHPRAGDVSVASFFLQRCTQCKRCTEECPFGAINEDAKGTPEYKPLRCRRCGICLGACPERIVSFPEYSVDAVASMIKAIEVPEEDEEKPRIIAFMCENDALPALDEAAMQRMQWNPWIRVIPVRCLGAVNTVWIADSFSRGIDGVLLIGCKRGDDTQCHYVRGSELAHTRMSNVQETLNRLTLEPERVSVLELSREEWQRIPQIFEEFAKKIQDIGPNPYKGL